MNMLPIIIVCGILLVAGIVIYSRMQAQARRQALAEWAAQQGLAFAPDNVGDLDGRFPSFACLQEGRNRYAYNLASGLWHERHVLAFDYHYETHSTNSKGESETTHWHFSAVIVHSEVPLKPLLIRPEGFFDKVKSFFGFEDINFESAEFSRKFFVQAPDRKWAYDVLHQRALEFLLVSPVFSLAFDARAVIAWRGATCQPAEFTQALTVVRGLLDQLPAYVLKEQKGGVS
jgi:hypothetical protein